MRPYTINPITQSTTVTTNKKLAKKRCTSNKKNKKTQLTIIKAT